MKYLLVLYYLLANFMLLQAQNIIANSGFQDINFCHKYQENCSPKAWRSTSPKLFAYHKTSNGRFISLKLLNEARSKDRKYAQTELLCPLEVGKRYLIKLKVRPSQLRIEEFGLLFKQKFSYTEHPKITDGQYVALQLPNNTKAEEWQEIQAIFQAENDAKFVVLGNFLEDTETEVAPFDPKKYKKENRGSYVSKHVQYAFDDIEIRCLDSMVLCDMESTRNRLYFDSIRHTMEHLHLPELLIETPELQDTFSFLPKIEPPKIDIPKKIILRDLAYQSNEWQITNTNIPELDKLIEWMQENEAIRIQITGYTDDVGAEIDNLQLSQNRALGVFEYLRAQEIAAQRMDVSGKGEANPVTDNTTKTGRKLNRRVEILILDK